MRKAPNWPNAEQSQIGCLSDDLEVAWKVSTGWSGGKYGFPGGQQSRFLHRGEPVFCLEPQNCRLEELWPDQRPVAGGVFN